MRMPATLSRTVLAVVAALMLLAAPAALHGGAPARAADVPLIAGPVTDQSGVLRGGEAQIEDAVARTLDSHRVQVWVVFVDTTGGTPVTDFARETAIENSLGTNDILLFVAVEDRTDAIRVDDALESITDGEVDDVIGEVLEPGLASGDFVGAVVSSIEALGVAASTPDGGGFEDPDAGGGGGGGGGGLTLLAGLLVIAGIGLVAWWFVAWRRGRRDREERDRRTGRLAREANALLIATDERVRDSIQEIGFVEAEYGEEEVAPLRQAVAEAREELRAAFAVRQRLDDAEPETPEQREALLNEIVARSKRAQAALDREAARIQALRDLERDAPAILERLPERVAGAEARLPGARAAFDALAAFAASTRAPVVGHVEEARKGLDGATAAIERGRAALSANDRKAAAREARTAEQGVAGATALLDAIDKLAAGVREAQQRIPAELREAETDLAAARTAAASATPGGGHESRIAAATTALREAQGASGAVPLDPVVALRAATEAHRLADEALAAVRQDAEQRARFLAAVDTSLATAQADLDRASDFVAARRGSVGRQARTRLAEADRMLEQALALRDRDPQQALDAARRAERLAEEAYDLADDDFGQWGGMGGMGGMGGGRRASPGADLAGAVLGGILGGILSGGGRGGGGWGGSPWGSSGPFGGGGGGGGGWGGPFGGGGGGGFGGGGGGGGGRVRGGRW